MVSSAEQKRTTEVGLTYHLGYLGEGVVSECQVDGTPSIQHRPDPLSSHKSFEGIFPRGETGLDIQKTEREVVYVILLYGGRFAVLGQHEENFGKREWVKGDREPITLGIGMLEIPGGGVEPGEAREDAVLRELYEETGLEVSQGGVHNSLPPVSDVFQIGKNGRLVTLNGSGWYTELTQEQYQRLCERRKVRLVDIEGILRLVENGEFRPAVRAVFLKLLAHVPEVLNVK